MYKFSSTKAGDKEIGLKVRLERGPRSRKAAYPGNCMDLYGSSLLYARSGRAQSNSIQTVYIVLDRFVLNKRKDTKLDM